MPQWCGTGSRRCRPTPTTPRDRRAGRGPRAHRRRGPSLPRRHLVAVGHHARATRCPSSTRPSATSSTASPTRPCWATATGSSSSWPRRSLRVVPVDEPHFLFASDGAAAVEQALKIAFQFWANLGVGGRTGYLAFGDAYHGDTVGSLSVGAGGFGTDLFDPLRFAVIRAPGFDDPGAASTAALSRRRCWSTSIGHLAAVVLEPLVQGAAGMLDRRPASLRQLGEACRGTDVLLICDEVATGFGRTGTLFASEQCGLRPDLMCHRQGHHRRLPADVGHRRVATACTTRSSVPTWASAPSTTAIPTAGTPWPRRWRCATCGCSATRDVLANVGARADQLAARCGRPRRPCRVSRRAPARPDGRASSSHPPADGLRWGRRVAPPRCVARGVLLRPLGDVVVSCRCSPPPPTRSTASCDRWPRRSPR